MHETCDLELNQQLGLPNYPVRLGIIGGGQLVRMTAMSALPLGVDVVVLEDNPFSPAARLSSDSIVGDWSHAGTLQKFAAHCDVVTLENEFVDAAALELLERSGHKVFPSAACLALTQDKFNQKQALQKAELAVPKFRAVRSPAEVISAAKDFGWPLLLKTRRSGYDGKGNSTLHSEADLERAWQLLGGDQRALLVEAFFPFAKELATIVTRGRDGRSVIYPVVETIQQNHICHIVKAPAQISGEVARRATALAQRAVEAVGGVGSFGVEMFLAGNGGIVINRAVAAKKSKPAYETVSEFLRWISAKRGLVREASSLKPQRDDRIDARGAPGGKIARG